MPTADLDQLIQALEAMQKASGFAYQYGPYFFAVTFLLLVPFAALAAFKYASQKSPDGKFPAHAYGDFRLYFRGTIFLGFFCVLVGVGVWVFENFRQVNQLRPTIEKLSEQVKVLQAALGEKKYIVVGLIADGIDESDEFAVTFLPKHTFVLSRLLAANDLFFVVLSDEPIPTNLDLMVTYGQFDGSTKTRARPITLPVQLTVMKTPLGR
jgi:hypothetical protein